LPSLKLTLNNRWFVAGLSLLAVAMAARALLAPGLETRLAPGRAHAAPSPAPAAALAPAPAEPAALAGAAEVSGRDPFAARPRLSLAPPVVDTAHLSALWTENGETLALVNGRILRPGDAVGRMKVESATQDGVWVAHAQGRDFIALGGTFVLTSPAIPVAAVALSP
jgi:hypothetical protein